MQSGQRKTRVLVLGASGMLGQAVRWGLQLAGIEVFNTQRVDRERFDYLDVESADVESQLDTILARVRPEYLINCMGVLQADIDQQENASVLRAIRVNAAFPHLAANGAERHGAELIHMSTDGVFCGESPRPYVESDKTDALDVYGKTKALGESGSDAALNVRCSIVGPDSLHRHGLLEWLRRAPEDTEVTGYADQKWNGVTTNQFAALCAGIVRTRCFKNLRRCSPVIHFCPNPVITKFDLLNLWSNAIGQRVRIRPAESGWTGRLLATEQECWRQAYPHSPSWRELLIEASGVSHSETGLTHSQL